MKRLAFVLAILGMTACDSKSETYDGLLEIQASHLGRFAEKQSWTLSVDNDAQAKLTVLKGVDTTRQFQVPVEKLAELRNALKKEKFFELPAEIGKIVPDGGTCKIAIKVGEKQHEIAINFVHESSLTKAEMNQAKRALRVWAKVRDLFDDKDAIDSRTSDERLLKD